MEAASTVARSGPDQFMFPIPFYFHNPNQGTECGYFRSSDEKQGRPAFPFFFLAFAKLIFSSLVSGPFLYFLDLPLN
ncbi:hypothetical protein E1A91_D11G018500v1 [Gossypium mustelinum]|uniref:Uncharacterized protein n=1 Tax=Gossypium mustelinum TaxID=34275 RepID=A0A5D2SM11_GOSMU|nr:hypothetical protein E1A91_D11G018500v1 [Gossypium mustelinum]